MSNTDLQSLPSLHSSSLMSGKPKKMLIRKSKLPTDFFDRKNASSNKSMDSIQGYSTEENSPRVSTPSFNEIQKKQRKQINCEKYLKFRAQNVLIKGQELIRDVILTSRNLNRYIRKRSVDMRGQSKQLRKRQNSLSRQLMTPRKSFQRKSISRELQSSEEFLKLPKLITNRYKKTENFIFE